MSSLPRIMIGVVGVRVIGDCDPIRPAIRHSVPSSRYIPKSCLSLRLGRAVELSQSVPFSKLVSNSYVHYEIL